MKKIFILFVAAAAALPLQGEFKVLAGSGFSRYELFPESGGNLWGHTRWGLTGGIGFERKILDFLWLELDLTVIQKGSRVDAEDGAIHYRLNSVSAPVLLKWKPFFHTSPYLTGGAEIHYGLSHKRSLGQEEAEDIKDTTGLFGWGFAFGAGLDWKIKEHLFLFFELRYSYDVSNIDAGFSDNEAVKSRSFLFLFGIKS